MYHNDPSNLLRGIESRAITFENPTGGRGMGGQAHRGRKGRPNKMLKPGDKVTLGDIEGPGTIRHIWMTFPEMPPEDMRSVWLEVNYDELTEPSISVPCLDFFGLPHGRTVPHASHMTAVQEGRGFNAYYPMPFNQRIRLELTNSSRRTFPFYYQLDYTLDEGTTGDSGHLHASFCRSNPTVLKEDFVITEGLTGPGRYLGCVVGIRVLPSEMSWYGEGELKIFMDGDREFPTICGTGLEDYVGTAWGMGTHATAFGGVPYEVRDPASDARNPDYSSFYRWHVPDPVVFAEELKVTLQQIGSVFIPEDDAGLMERIENAHEIAGPGWYRNLGPGMRAFGLVERQDDYCATAFVYCEKPQPVPRLDLDSVKLDVGWLGYESRAGEEDRFAEVGAVTTDREEE